MPRHSKVAPYEIARSIHLTIHDPHDPTNPELDLEWSDKGEDDEGFTQLDLRGNEWRQLDIEIEARLELAELNRILPHGAADISETRMVISVRCPATKLRQVVALEPTPGNPGAWGGDVELDRRLVRNRVELHPMLVRSSSIPSEAAVTEGLSRQANTLIAWGRPYCCSIDLVERSITGPVAIKWRDFGDGSNPWLTTHKDSLYFLDVDPDQPVLWLNSRHKALNALLFYEAHGPQGRGRNGPDADLALQRMLCAWLAETVWQQLFIAALGAVNEASTEDDPSYPDGWRGDLLRRYLPLLFEEESDPGARLRLAVSQLDSQDQFSALLGKASTITQALAGSAGQFRGAVRAAERSSNPTPPEAS